MWQRTESRAQGEGHDKNARANPDRDDRINPIEQRATRERFKKREETKLEHQLKWMGAGAWRLDCLGTHSRA